MGRGEERRGEEGWGGSMGPLNEVSFAAGRPGDIKKFTLQKFDLVDFKSIKLQRLRTAGPIPQNVARVGCVACLASVAVAPRLPSPCSCSVAVRWAWTQSHYAS